MNVQDICNNWEEIPQTKKPIWFWIVENIQKELSAAGADRNVQMEILQSIKEMYGIALQKYVIQE